MMKRTAIHLSLLCWLLLVGSLAAASPAPVLLVGSADARIELAPWLDSLPPGMASLDTAEVLARTDELPWNALGQRVLAQGHQSHGIWLRLKLRNEGLAQTRIIEFTRANIGRIEVISKTAAGRWQRRFAGASEWVPRGDVSGPGYSFSVFLPEGSSSLLLHLQSDYPLATPIRLSTSQELLRGFQNSAAFFGTLLGLLGGISIGMTSLRSARLSIATRWVAAMLINVVILHALIERDILGYWWLDVPSSQYSLIQLSQSLLGIMHLLLCRQFLTEKQVAPGFFHPLLRLSILANLIWMLIALAWLPNQWSPIGDGLRWLSQAAILVMLWSPMRLGTPGSVPYFLLVALHLLCQLGIDASLQGWLPFLAEPYEAELLWHLLAMPLLLHALELPAIRGEAVARTTSETVVPQPASRRVSLPGKSTAAIRVLVVEDNPWVQQVLAGLLLKLNCQSSLASDGQEALACLAREHFDLVLMDCDLPILDGFSCTREWRNQAGPEPQASSPHLPIIAITAHVSASYRLQAQEAGMDDFLQKPIDMRALHDMLIRWLPNYATRH